MDGTFHHQRHIYSEYSLNTFKVKRFKSLKLLLKAQDLNRTP